MRITTYQKNAFTVVRFVDAVELFDDIRELRETVEKEIEGGRTNIAVRFTKDSFLRSASMATLVLCAALVNSHAGIFALVEPSESIVTLLHVFGAEALVRIVDSEDMLSTLKAEPRAAV